MSQGPIFYALGQPNGGDPRAVYISQVFSDGEIYRIEARGLPPATDALGGVTTFLGRLPFPSDFVGTSMFVTPPTPLPNNLFAPAPGTPFNADPAVDSFLWAWDGIAFANDRIFVSQQSQYPFKVGTAAFPHGTNLFSIDPAVGAIGGAFGQIILPPKDAAGVNTNGLQFEGTLPFVADMAKLATSPNGDFIFVAAGNCGGFFMDPADGRVSAVNAAGLVPRLQGAADAPNGLFRFCLTGVNA